MSERLERPWWRRSWLLTVVLLGAVVAAYQPIWHAGFIWDDDVFLVDNPLIKSVHGLYQFWFTRAAPDYFPASSTSLWLEWRLWGAHALGYHLTNVALHALSALFWWRVLAALRLPGAWLAAAIFALHPVNVESVAWITERKNTLAMLFFVLTLWAWLRGRATGAANETSAPALMFRSPWYWVAWLGFVLGLLSKTAVAPLPVVLLGLTWWQRGRLERRDLWPTVPFFAAALVLGLVTIFVQYHQAIGDTVVRTDGMGSRTAAAGCAVWFYLYKAILPLNLSFVYPRWQIDPTNVASYIPALGVVALLLLGWPLRSRWGRGAWCGFAYFVLLLLPILGFLNIYFMRYSLVADHWQYFALMGPVALVAAGLATALRRWFPTPSIILPALGAVLLLGLGGLTWRQCRTYADAATLWRATVAQNPDAFLAQNNLGIILLGQERVEEAIPHLEKAIAIKPDYAEAHSNLASALLAKGQVDDAMAHFKRALEFEPRSADIHNNLGNVFLRQGAVDEALRQYLEALEYRPKFAVAHCNAGAILLQRGQLDDARTHYQAALAADPTSNMARYNVGYIFLQQHRLDEAIALFEQALATEPKLAPAHFQLGNALAEKGRVDEAMACYRKTLELEPGCVDAHVNLAGLYFQKRQPAEVLAHSRAALQLQPDDPKLLASLAWLLATWPDAVVRNGAEAVRLAERANQLTAGRNLMAQRALAAAYAEAGRFDDAVAAAQRALELAESDSNRALAETLRQQLKLHAARLPFHESLE